MEGSVEQTVDRIGCVIQSGSFRKQRCHVELLKDRAHGGQWDHAALAGKYSDAHLQKDKIDHDGMCLGDNYYKPENLAL